MNPCPLPILQPDSLRAIEARHARAVPPLMERAGQAAAAIAATMLPAGPQRVLIVAGPGNNCGDGFVVARLLHQAGHDVSVAFSGTAERLPQDALAAHDAWLAAGGFISSDYPEGGFALVVDALFGIGLSRPLEGQVHDWIDRINQARCPVLALDIPSGLDAKTGVVHGLAVHAACTASFIALKPGLLTADGPDHCGRVEHCPLGIETARSDGEVIGLAHFADFLRPRRKNSHKGCYGKVAVIGGAAGMSGAALLAGRAALMLGAGRVYLGLIEPLPLDPVQPELMLRTPQDALAHADILALGPGLGLSVAAAEILNHSLDSDLPLVLDADALNLLCQGTLLLRKIAVRPAPTFLTPHPAEAARLLGQTTEQVQADRIAAATSLAQRLKCLVVLKGCGSIVATPDGRWFINGTGNPGLASAGSGDVLTGMLAALLAQAWPPLAAVPGAVHLHGAAADAGVESGAGPVGLTAGELIELARLLLNRWITGVHA